MFRSFPWPLQFHQPPNPVSSTPRCVLFLQSILPPSQVDVHPHSSGWWCPACLTVSTCAASAVNFFHLRYLQTIPSDHVLSRPAQPPLCYFLWFWDQVYLSLCITRTSVFQQLWEPHALSSLTYITLFPPPLPWLWPSPTLFHSFFCLSACAYLYPCNYFHMVLVVVCPPWQTMPLWKQISYVSN